MRFYMVVKKNGDIIESADAGEGFNFNKKMLIFNNKDKQVVEIQENSYNEIKTQMEYFTYSSGKLKKKSKTKINTIDKAKEKFRRSHTMEGLQEQIDELRDIIKIDKE